MFLRDCETADKQLGFSIQAVKFAKLEDMDRAFDEINRAGAQAPLIAPMREIAAETRRLVEMSHQHRLPTVHLRKSFVAAGGLMSYGVDYPGLYRGTASYADRILKGAKPGELPIEQPARYELYVNSTSAKALSLPLPESIMLRADKVIE